MWKVNDGRRTTRYHNSALEPSAQVHLKKVLCSQALATKTYKKIYLFIRVYYAGQHIEIIFIHTMLIHMQSW